MWKQGSGEQITPSMHQLWDVTGENNETKAYPDVGMTSEATLRARDNSPR